MDDKRLLRYRYMFFDIIAALTVWILFTYFRQIVNDGRLFEHVRIFIPKYNFISSIVVYPLLCLFIHWLSGFYIRPLQHNKMSVFLTTLISTALISIVIFFVLLLDDFVVSYEYYYYSLLVLLGLNFIVFLTFRMFIVVSVRRKFRTKKWTINTAIIGFGGTADKFSSEIQMEERRTFAGFISPKSGSRIKKEKVIGNIRDMGKIIGEYNIEEIVIALDNPSDQELFSIINGLFHYNIEISFAPRLYEILTGSAKIEDPRISPLVSITKPSMPDWQACVKRFSDVFFSFLALVILLIPMIIIAIAIKTDSKGSVFYLQERIGRFGRPFKMIKFRTMVKDSEGGIPQLSSPDDNRVTKVGHYLRKYRIDEVPQFLNILIGDMSLVGPRPERTYFINQITQIAPYYCLLYKIRPGLTSWGPIRIGYSDTIEKMVERLNYDIIYMDNMSLRADFKILIYTFEIIFKGKGV